MDMDMADLLTAVAETITAAPDPDAPSDYLHQRSMIVADVLRAVADGAHPADALDDLERRLDTARRPASSDLMVWAPARVTA